MKLTRHSGGPVLTPVKHHGWENRTVFNCGVAQHDGKIILLYRAQGTHSDVSRLGYAESLDGIHFERAPEPVFSPAAPTEALGVEDPRLTFLEGRWQMLYTAWSPGNIQVALASTEDFRTWNRHGVVLPGPDNKDAALFPGKVGGRYVMFHRIPPAIWLAYSDDLLHWGDFQRIMEPRPGLWDALKLGAGGPPIETPEGWLVIYHGVDRDRVYRLGVALLDRDDPARVLHWPEQPILEPEEPWELNGDVPNVVFTCGTAEVGDEYYVYYGGADKVIGLATGRKDQLLQFAMSG
ncbi:MAG: glycosidase [Chloroflexia bacterium]|nr:glycosidase [Chloroflexia bacterium]